MTATVNDFLTDFGVGGALRHSSPFNKVFDILNTVPGGTS